MTTTSGTTNTPHKTPVESISKLINNILEYDILPKIGLSEGEQSTQLKYLTSTITERMYSSKPLGDQKEIMKNFSYTSDLFHDTFVLNNTTPESIDELKGAYDTIRITNAKLKIQSISLEYRMSLDYKQRIIFVITKINKATDNFKRDSEVLAKLNLVYPRITFETELLIHLLQVNNSNKIEFYKYLLEYTKYPAVNIVYQGIHNKLKGFQLYKKRYAPQKSTDTNVKSTNQSITLEPKLINQVYKLAVTNFMDRLSEYLKIPFEITESMDYGVENKLESMTSILLTLLETKVYITNNLYYNNSEIKKVAKSVFKNQGIRYTEEQFIDDSDTFDDITYALSSSIISNVSYISNLISDRCISVKGVKSIFTRITFVRDYLQKFIPMCRELFKSNTIILDILIRVLNNKDLPKLSLSALDVSTYEIDDNRMLLYRILESYQVKRILSGEALKTKLEEFDLDKEKQLSSLMVQSQNKDKNKDKISDPPAPTTPDQETLTIKKPESAIELKLSIQDLLFNRTSNIFKEDDVESLKDRIDTILNLSDTPAKMYENQLEFYNQFVQSNFTKGSFKELKDTSDKMSKLSAKLKVHSVVMNTHLDLDYKQRIVYVIDSVDSYDMPQGIDSTMKSRVLSEKIKELLEKCILSPSIRITQSMSVMNIMFRGNLLLRTDLYNDLMSYITRNVYLTDTDHNFNIAYKKGNSLYRYTLRQINTKMCDYRLYMHNGDKKLKIGTRCTTVDEEYNRLEKLYNCIINNFMDRLEKWSVLPIDLAYDIQDYTDISPSGIINYTDDLKNIVSSILKMKVCMTEISIYNNDELEDLRKMVYANESQNNSNEMWLQINNMMLCTLDFEMSKICCSIWERCGAVALKAVREGDNSNGKLYRHITYAKEFIKELLNICNPLLATRITGHKLQLTKLDSNENIEDNNPFEWDKVIIHDKVGNSYMVALDLEISSYAKLIINN
jgi:hypothetical protein